MEAMCHMLWGSTLGPLVSGFLVANPILITSPRFRLRFCWRSVDLSKVSGSGWQMRTCAQGGQFIVFDSRLSL